MNLGTDIERIKRFNLDKESVFIQNNFTRYEINYSFSKTLPAQHLCGIFCAKEALFKSLNNDFKITNLEVEVRHNDLNRPFIEILNQNFNKLNTFELSISHAGEYATATVIKIKNGK
jgi:holo-[acyl-carrier protein] synthase